MTNRRFYDTSLVRELTVHLLALCLPPQTLMRMLSAPACRQDEELATLESRFYRVDQCRENWTCLYTNSTTFLVQLSVY